MLPIPDLATALQAITYTKELYDSFKPLFDKIVVTKSDQYLNYDPSFLLRKYAGEKPISQGLTYAQLCEFSDLVPLDQPWDDTTVRIKVQKGDFHRTLGTSQWQEVSAAAFTARKAAGRTRTNEPCIRVSKVKHSGGMLHITVQRAHYYDQAMTNLVLDFDRRNPSSYVSLRTQLDAKYDNHLPPLKDGRLANTLGIATLIFYWGQKGTWVPYIVRRVKKIGVFPGGLHCTASGVAIWPDGKGESTLQRYATEHMLAELDEEVGLKPDDISDLRPIAICREMARGGKPQIFYAGLTMLNRKELRERRIKANKIIKATTRMQELERDRWLRSADVVMTPSKLKLNSGRWGLTLEGAASLHYGVRYLESIGPYLKKLRAS